MTELTVQTRQGFYGDSDRHVGVDAQRASVIEHAHGFCNHLIEQDDALSGSITDLTTASQPRPLDVDEDVQAEMDPFPGAMDEGDREA